ncbi:LPS biosynthesis protein [Halomonas cupida]|uniref:Glycosyltransferase involved in cell wall bisynthesis n=2 Tax=Halomonas cupida TaxID=44933 RepID=A0A1M7GJY7_9GAMM|nr:LPS biosynthesis protein [Halomonas cupida]SHM16455.1 Glycosyltransferase involved in cell wall bisynthesis [Halomonas cupida]
MSHGRMKPSYVKPPHLKPSVMQICLSEGWGGLEMYPSRIIPELEAQGWQVSGLALTGSRVASSMRDAGIEPLTVRTRGAALWQLRQILGWLRERDIRLLHCHKSSDLRLAALLATLNADLRVIFTDHMGVTRPKKDLYHRWAYGHVSRLLSISEATRKRNLKAFPLPAERIQRLYLGIDPAALAPRLDAAERRALRTSLGIPWDAVTLGVAGRLTPGKGQRVFVEAFAYLVKEHPELNAHAVVIGGLTAEEGSREEYVVELQQLVEQQGLAEHITFTGFRRDLARLFEVLDVVCVPSRNEAFGLTVVEAMAAGKAVIGSASGAIPELINTHSGRLADPETPREWANAMLELVGDANLRASLGDNASERVFTYFRMSTHIAALVDVYQDVLDQQ